MSENHFFFFDPGFREGDVRRRVRRLRVERVVREFVRRRNGDEPGVDVIKPFSLFTTDGANKLDLLPLIKVTLLENIRLGDNPHLEQIG